MSQDNQSDAVFTRARQILQEREAIEALKQLTNAVRALGRFKDGKTLFEGSPIKDQDCYEAWKALNDAQRRAATVLKEPGLLFSQEWLQKKIGSDPDVETDNR